MKPLREYLPKNLYLRLTIVFIVEFIFFFIINSIVTPTNIFSTSNILIYSFFSLVLTAVEYNWYHQDIASGKIKLDEN